MPADDLPSLEPGLADLAAFRAALRDYLSFAQAAAEARGLTMQQHQVLLELRIAPAATLSMGQLAEAMRLRHHSAVELVDRLTKAGLAERRHDPDDGRRVQVALTDKGAKALYPLAGLHLDWFARADGRRLAGALRRLRKSAGN